MSRGLLKVHICPPASDIPWGPGNKDLYECISYAERNTLIDLKGFESVIGVTFTGLSTSWEPSLSEDKVPLLCMEAQFTTSSGLEVSPHSERESTLALAVGYAFERHLISRWSSSRKATTTVTPVF